MKLFTFFMLIGCMHLSASGGAQNVNLSLKEVSLEKAFNEVRKQTGYSFVYYKDDLKKAGKVSVHVKNISVEQAMQLILKDQPLAFALLGNTIVIKAKEEVAEYREEPEISIPAFIDVTGRITDAKTGEPIVGASVTVKGTRQGSTTNLQGRFTISTDPGKVLVISSVGYASQEITVGQSTALDIRMEVTNESMKDVVVTGRFNKRASTTTGAVSSFSQQDLMKAGTTNVIQSLKNLEPAFFIPENNISGSNPNALPDIQVRGQTGLPDIRGEYATNPNNPLFILDGVPVSLQTIVDLDMNRIKSATLLLDAASKAIYGSRAANGVLVIETTVPRSGKILLSYSSNIIVSAPDLSSYNLTNAREKLDVEVAAGLYVGSSGPNTYTLKQIYNQYLTNVESGVNTDWLSKPVRNGLGQQHSLSFEGGESEGMRYMATVRYYNQVGVMKGSNRNTLTGALKLNYRIKSLNFSNTFTVNDNKANNSPWGAFSQYVQLNPYLPYLDENGNIAKQFNNITRQNGVAGTSVGAPPGFLLSEAVYNPAYNSTLNIIDATKYTQYINNFNLDWLITPEIRLNGIFGLTKEISQGDQYFPSEHTMFTTSEFSGDNAFRRGRYNRSNGDNLSYLGNLTLSYGRSWNKHSVTVNLPLAISEIKGNSTSFSVEGFPNDRLSNPTGALQYYTTLSNRPLGTESRIRRAEGAITGNYAFDDTYFVEFTAGKSKGTDAGPDVPWSTNWSVGAGWNLHNESFIKSLKFIDRLRVSANTGFTGADGFSSFDGVPSYLYFTNASYATMGNGAYLSRLANPELVPQRTQEHGFEGRLGLFRRIGLTFRYYIRNTEGLSTYITTPPSVGFADYKANIGRSQNKGFNANVNYMVFSNAKNRNSLNIWAGVAHNTNKLVEVANSFKLYNQAQDALSTRSPRTRFIEGQSLSVIWAVPSLGIDPATGREIYLKKDGTQTYTWSAADQVAAGDALPKYNGNFGFRLEVKGVELNTIFTYMYGGQQYNQTLVDRVENADVYKNVDKRVFTDRWRKPGDRSYFKNIADFSITQASSRFVEDRNQLTLGSLDIGYDLVRNIAQLKNIGFSRLRIGFTTTEVFVASTIRTERGTSYPFARNFTFNINASF